MDNQINLQQVRKLIKMLEDSSLHELKIKSEGMSVQLTKPTVNNSPTSSQQPQVVVKQAAAVEPAPVARRTQPEEEKAIPGTPVVSPMVGTFFSAPSPTAESFVKPGDKVSKGDVLCIVEAMKMMNHIKATQSGTIGEVLIENGQPVEYGQHLMMILD